jgi:hypothetical protein
MVEFGIQNSEFGIVSRPQREGGKIGGGKSEDVATLHRSNTGGPSR